MFRKDLESKLSEIFGVKKVTFDAFSESYAQDTLFVEVQDVSNQRASKGRASAKVTGQLVIFTQDNKMPYGFFSKRLSTAPLSASKDLFFFDMDREALNSPARLQNISERRASFVFLFSTAYNPSKGEITSVEFDRFTIDAEEGDEIDIGDGGILGA